MPLLSHPHRSALDAQLIAAYAQTHYRVLGVLPFTVLIAQPCAALDSLMQQHGKASASYITAWNPYSRQPFPSRAENRAAHAQLKADLQDMSLPFLPAIGLDPKREWRGEPGFLVLGLNTSQLQNLCLRYGQNAAVYGELGSAPDLWLAR
jgi:hypothetical protein